MRIVVVAGGRRALGRVLVHVIDVMIHAIHAIHAWSPGSLLRDRHGRGRGDETGGEGRYGCWFGWARVDLGGGEELGHGCVVKEGAHHLYTPLPVPQVRRCRL